jgi:hypothetical protein
MRLLVCLAAALCSVVALAQRPGGPPNVLVAVIDQRDYQGNTSTTERALFPTPHPGLEFSAHRGTPQQPDTHQNVSHVAYVKGATSTISLRLTNQQNTTATGTLTFTGAQLVVPGPNNAPAPQELPVSLTCSSPTFTLPPFASTTMTATLSGLPSHVAVGQLQVKFELPVSYGPPGNPGSSNNGTAGGWVNWERICILDSAPIGLQAVPWTDFLEYTCRWAFGASGPAAVRREMTKGIFYGNRSPWNRLYYNSAINNYWKWTDADGNYIGTGPYRLGLLLGTLSSPINRQQSSQIWTSADCRDFAGLLFLAISSHGASSSCTILTGPTRILLDVNGNPVLDEDQQPIFTSHYNYWPLCPAGSDPTDTDIDSDFSAGSYTSGAFNFHVVIESSGLRFDAAAAHYYSSSGGPWYNPVFDWSSASHWQRSSPWPYHGHAFSLNAKFNFLTTPFGQGNETVTLSQTYENPIYLVGSGTP